MKTKHIYFFCLLFISTSFPQVFDSTAVDTVILADSSSIILSDSAASDTSALFSAIKDSAVVDTLVPLYQEPFSPFSYFISHNDILRTDYEYAGDILNLYPFRFIEEKAFYGQGDYFYYFGAGIYPEVTGYLKDKILIDNRNPRGFNLNLVQTESIDSIEIINLPRSFLYSGIVNTTIVNFIEKDFISLAPYTRIKYYEGPFGQALFDGIFNTLVFNRLNFFLDITNRTADDSYKNTEYGSWQATAKLKYIASNKLNIIGSYNFADIEAGANRGINADSISRITEDVENLLYDEIRAPVISTSGREEMLQHNFNLQALWKPDKQWKTDLKIYSLFNQLTDVYNDSSVEKNKISSLGFMFDQSYSHGILGLKVTGGFESNNVDDSYNYISSPGRQFSIFSFAPIASFYLADSMIVPSVFYKYSSVSTDYGFPDGSTSGLGFDANFILGNFKAYFGYSEFENIYNSRTTENIEAGIAYKSDSIFGNIRYFSVSRNQYQGIVVVDRPVAFSGVGLIIKLNLWKMIFENYSQYYFDDDYGWNEYYRLRTGLYYKDILFKNNLDIKAGFEFIYNKAAEPGFYLPESIYSLYTENNYRLDFTLSGIIRNRAILYFTWENITNNNYFIVPYYPMPERNIRFGLSWELFN